ncbi:MAG: leucine-rich repeat domain-containing protein [Pirellulaceae bacterium]
MCPTDRGTVAARILLVSVVLTGCDQRPVREASTSVVERVVAATPREVLNRLRDLGSTFRLDAQGRVWALSFHRCPLNDGDLEILQSLPEVRTLNLRGVSVVGGRLSVKGMQPLASLQNLRRLDLSMNQFTGRLDPIASLAQLEFLDLRGSGFGDEAIQSVARMPRLRTLLLGHSALTERGLKALSGSSLAEFDYWLRGDQDVAILGGLKKLQIWFIGYGNVPVSRLGAFADCDQLQEITLTCDGVECPVQSISALRSMRSLKRLQISGPANAEWPVLTALDGLAELNALRLVGIGDRALRQLPPVESLQTLDLALSSAGSREGLQKLGEFPELRHVALPPETTTADGLASVAGCSQLQTLVFAPNLIGGSLQAIFPAVAETTPGFAAADLCPVLRQTGLKTLRVDGLGFGDELMMEVSAAKHLEYLGVAGLPITDAGLERLRHLRHLQVLDIEHTAVTYEAAQTLHRDYLPQCRITDNWCCGCMTIEPRVP